MAIQRRDQHVVQSQRRLPADDLVNSIAVDPTNPFKAYGGSQDNGFEVYDPTNPLTPHPTWNHTDAGDSGTVLMNPNTPQTIYHVRGNTLVKSTNGGTPGLHWRRP